MKLINAWLGNNGESVLCTPRGGDRKPIKKFQVRWVLDPGNGRMAIERKRTDFLTKSEAKLFIEQLKQASYGVDDWTFDVDGNPVKSTSQGPTVFHSVERYIARRWKVDWQERQRGKVRGRLIVLVAFTLNRPKDRDALLAAMPEQRGVTTPKALTNDVERAAFYLTKVAFYPTIDDTSDDAVAGRRWIEARSMAITAFTSDDGTALRNHLCDGKSRNTFRTYWSGIIVPFFNWAVDTKLLRHDPLVGMPKLSRDVEAERPDRRNIPDPSELAALAAAFGHRHGERWELVVLLTG